jgi:polyisoprenoid-binding protein YceI
VTQRSPSTLTTRTARPDRRRWLLVGVVGLAAIVLAGVAAWVLFFGGDAPAAPNIDEAAGAVTSPSPAASVAPSASPDAGASTQPATSSGTTEGLDGTWVVDTSIGSFEDFSGTWVGFRVDEVLAQGIGGTTAVGRTPDVSGSLDLSGTTIESATIEADLTTIESDRSRRDGAIQRSLETSTYPTATFVLTAPLDLGALPEEGQTISVTASGDLTIHGVTKEVEFPLQAQLVGDTVAVVGSLDVVFSDFGVDMPSAPIVVSVEDQGTLEIQLFLRRP